MFTNNNGRYEKTKSLIEEHLNEIEEFEFKPFTIIEGGRYNDCRYVTLPTNFPVPKSAYYLGSDKFYKNFETTTNYVDFVGLIGMKNNRPCILCRYALNTLLNTGDLKELVTKAIRQNKFTLVLGISKENACGKDLNDIIHQIKEELENVQC